MPDKPDERRYVDHVLSLHTVVSRVLFVAYLAINPLSIRSGFAEPSLIRPSGNRAGRATVVGHMESLRKGRFAIAALAISIGATAVIVIVVGLATSSRPEPAPGDSAVAIERPVLSDVYDPVRAGEAPPPGFRQLLGRDQIAPVYDPVYVARDEVDWPADSLVLGVAGAKTSKAYPITHLNQREMVIDSLDGTPILASW